MGVGRLDGKEENRKELLQAGYGELSVAVRAAGAGGAFAGEVVQVGPGVKGFVQGDRVVVEARVPCGLCPRCRAGLGNHCADAETLIPAGDIVRVPRQAAWLLPGSLSYEDGCAASLVAEALHGVTKIGAGVGDRVALWGDARLADWAEELLRLTGAAVDRVTGKGSLMLSAVHSVDHYYDGVVLCGGGSPADAVLRSRPGGRLLLLGRDASSSGPPLYAASDWLPSAIEREISILTSRGYVHEFGDALDLLARRKG